MITTNLTKIKLGEKTQSFHFKLGNVRVADVLYQLTYSVSYTPEIQQHRSETVLLFLADVLLHKQMAFNTIEEAIEALKKECGEENFERLVRVDWPITDNIEEKMVIPPVI